MLLIFNVDAGDDGLDAVLVSTSDGVVAEDDNFVNAGANDVNGINDVSSVDECAGKDVWNVGAFTDEDGAAAVVDDHGTGNTAVVDSGVECGKPVPVCGLYISTLK